MLRLALGKCRGSRWLCFVGSITSLSPLATSVGCVMPTSRLRRVEGRVGDPPFGQRVELGVASGQVGGQVGGLVAIRLPRGDPPEKVPALGLARHGALEEQGEDGLTTAWRIAEGGLAGQTGHG